MYISSTQPNPVTTFCFYCNCAFAERTNDRHKFAFHKYDGISTCGLGVKSREYAVKIRYLRKRFHPHRSLKGLFRRGSYCVKEKKNPNCIGFVYRRGGFRRGWVRDDDDQYQHADKNA